MDTWTKVEDGLPEQKGEYIVAYYPKCWGMCDKRKIHVGLNSFRGKSCWAKEASQEVIAWMPKPTYEE